METYYYRSFLEVSTYKHFLKIEMKLCCNRGIMAQKIPASKQNTQWQEQVTSQESLASEVSKATKHYRLL